MVTICLCTGLCFTVYAEETYMYISDEVVPAYEIAKKLSSVLSINGTKATCESSAEGNDCVSLSLSFATRLAVMTRLDTQHWSLRTPEAVPL